MTKPILLALLLSLGAACRESPPPQQAGPGGQPARQTVAPATQAAQPARPIMVFVFVEAQGAPPSPLAQEWVKELDAVFAANPEQFKPAKTRSEAEVAVRIESAVPTPDAPDHAVMSGSILMGETASPFRLDYTGGPKAMAGRFAKYLTGQVEAARATAAKKPQK